MNDFDNDKLNSILSNCIDDALIQKHIISQLIPIAKTPYDSKMLRSIHLTTTKHVNILIKMYLDSSYNHSYEPKIKYNDLIGSFDDNLRDLFSTSFEHTCIYRYLYSSSHSYEHKDLLFEIFTDNQCISTKLSYLINAH